MNYIISGKGVLSHLLTDTIEQPHTTILSEEELSSSSLFFSEADVLYVPSETALPSVLQHMPASHKKQSIEILKDKYLFREALQPLYPDYFFKKLSLSELEKTSVPSNKTYIVKPTKGFFSYGIKIITAESPMKKISEEIAHELSQSSQYFSEDVISKNELLIEEFIPGEEYAVDMYYNKFGIPVITNIYFHPIPKYQDYFNVLYYSDKHIFDLLYTPLISFFTSLQKTLKVTSFPIHAEFKLDNGTLFPIEMNPLRFGGMGLADLADYAYGFNPFEAFFNNYSPDWYTLWEERKGKHFAWVLGYDGIHMNMHKFRPDHEKFKHDLGKILHYDAIDYRHNPVFASAYIQLDKTHLEKILAMDFDNYFIQLQQ